MIFRLLLLVRHADAEKNALDQFAGDEAADRLTMAGEKQLHLLTNEIELLIEHLRCASVTIAHADSGRAKATAVALARFSSHDPLPVPGFRSIRSGVAAGLTETQLTERHPEFSNALRLYREGVVSSYDIPYPVGAEPVIDFEREVLTALSDILANNPSELQIIVGHRSSITATLIHYARAAHSYPSNHFGFIPLDPCVPSCVDITAENHGILWVNRPITSQSLAVAAKRKAAVAHEIPRG